MQALKVWAKIVVAAVAIVGCATKGKEHRSAAAPSAAAPSARVPPVQAALGASSVFVHYTYHRRGRGAPPECSLTLAGRVSGETVALRLVSSEGEAFAACPAGVYGIAKVTCDGGRAAAFSGISDVDLHVDPDRLAYLGRLAVTAGADGGVRVRFARRRETASSLRSAFVRLPAAQTARMSSSFTGKRITPEMLDGAPHETFELRFRPAPGPAFDFRPFAARLEACAESEHGRNPAPIGLLSVHASFVHLATVAIEVRGANAFSDELSECVKTAFRDKGPIDQGPAEATFLF